MPLAFLAIGLILLVTALKGNQNEVAKTFLEDLIGARNFFVWAGVIAVIAVLGSVTRLHRPAQLLIALITVVYLLSQKGFWKEAETAITSLEAPAASTTTSVGKASDAGGATPASGGSAPSPASSPGLPSPATGGGGGSPLAAIGGFAKGLF